MTALNKFEHDGKSIAPPTIPEDVSTFEREVLLVALSQYGVSESKGRPNRGPQVDEYVRGLSGRYGYLLGSPWCGRFSAWAVEMAAKRLSVPSPLPPAHDLASWLKWLDWARESGRYRAKPAAGTVAILHDEARKYGHLYLVVNTDGDVNQTIEGNHGDKVDCCERDAALPIGYVYVGQ